MWKLGRQKKQTGILSLVVADDGLDAGFDVGPGVGDKHTGHGLRVGIVEVGEVQQGTEDGVIGVFPEVEGQDFFESVLLEQ